MDIKRVERNRVFISYSHQDADWLKRLHIHLKPLERDYGLDIWDDTKITPGSSWKDEIKKAVESAKVAVLLVSADFLASDFITTQELPQLLTAAKEEGATILPLIIAPSRFLRNKELSLFQAVNDPSSPLVDLAKSEQEKLFVKLTEHIEASLSLPLPWISTASREDQRNQEKGGDKIQDNEQNKNQSTSNVDEFNYESGEIPTDTIDSRASILTTPKTVTGIVFQEPKGIVDYNSPFYIERSGDRIALEAIKGQGKVIIIKAPGQMGKSTLLCRLINAAENEGKLVIKLDFQRLDNPVRAEGDRFFRQFCTAITYEMEKYELINEFDNIPLGNTERCTRYLSRHLLKGLNRPIILAMEEVDSIFDCKFRSDFFSMLRSWHIEGAFSSVWRQLDIVFVTSAEPYQLIDQGSPFNVGIVVELTDFTESEVSYLNQVYGSPLRPEQKRSLLQLVGGHPYLVRRSLYLVATHQITPDKLLCNANNDDGPFGEYIGSLLLRVRDDKELTVGLSEVLKHKVCSSERILLRLASLGLIRRKGRRVEPRCQLYEIYFKERLQ